MAHCVSIRTWHRRNIGAPIWNALRYQLIYPVIMDLSESPTCRNALFYKSANGATRWNNGMPASTDSVVCCGIRVAIPIQPLWIAATNRIPLHISMRINPPAQPNRILTDESLQHRIIIPRPIEIQPIAVIFPPRILTAVFTPSQLILNPTFCVCPYGLNAYPTSKL